MLLLDGQVHHDTHLIPMGNYVIEVGNYVSVTRSNLGNYVSADTETNIRRSAPSAHASACRVITLCDSLWCGLDGRHWASRWAPHNVGQLAEGAGSGRARTG